VWVLGLPGLVKGKSAHVITEVDPDGEPSIRQIVQAAEYGWCSETRIFQLFTDFGVRQGGIRSSK
jgi:hypothetical protein